MRYFLLYLSEVIGTQLICRNLQKKPKVEPKVEETKKLVVEEEVNDEPVEEDVQIPGGLMSSVIGKGGVAIKEIIKQSGAALNKDGSVMNIKGSKEEVESAKKLIQNIIKENTPSEIEMNVDKRYYAEVLGENASTIKTIQRETHASLNLNRATGLLKISGSEEEIKNAKAAVREIINNSSIIEVKIPVTEPSIRNIIGKGGSNILRIQKETKTKLEMNRDKLCVIAHGTKEQINDAKKQIEEMIGEADSEEEMALLQKDIAVVLGKRGSTIQRIQKESKANINLDKSTAILTIRGSKEEISTARKLIEDILEEESVDEEVIQINQRAVPALVGKKGATIQGIQKQSGASLNLDGNLLVISGKLDTIAIAKEMVKEITDKAPVSEIIQLNAQSIPLILGKAGSKIKEIQKESGARLDIDRQNLCVEIIGQMDQIQEAKKIVESLITTTHEFKIDPSTKVSGSFFEKKVFTHDEELLSFKFPIRANKVGKIIGRGGENLQNLQNETGTTCNIDKQYNFLVIDGTFEKICNARKQLSKSDVNINRYRIDSGEYGQIDLSTDEEDDKITNIIVGGTEKQLEKAKKFIQDVIAENQLEQENEKNEENNQVDSGSPKE